MKISISKSHREQITELRSKLVKVRAEIVGSHRDLAKFETRQAELAEEIAKLEAADPGDKKARAALRDARDEMELTEKRIEALNHEFTTVGLPARFRASALLREIAIVMERALKPVMDDGLDKVAQAMRPFYADDASARGAAWNSHLYCELSRYCVRRYGSIGLDTPVHMAEAVKFCDEVLSGELALEFNLKAK